ncbi:hypothetical protein GXB81_21005 [Paraburkholderia sp. Ac-20336]|uniref:hypothetical protein n=1 Tax=Paraburkholderia sp. Ac-20336 TaxID=2703886 RepID=UPI00198252AC|nr:hypothetical protein [Paraburkholderia sp. Ac-20336]MBN3805511.1 hypothetical protein [Paraburkholderia sp. Ac-20336]
MIEVLVAGWRIGDAVNPDEARLMVVSHLEGLVLNGQVESGQCVRVVFNGSRNGFASEYDVIANSPSGNVLVGG